MRFFCYTLERLEPLELLEQRGDKAPRLYTLHSTLYTLPPTLEQIHVREQPNTIIPRPASPLRLGRGEAAILLLCRGRYPSADG